MTEIFDLVFGKKLFDRKQYCGQVCDNKFDRTDIDTQLHTYLHVPLLNWQKEEQKLNSPVFVNEIEFLHIKINLQTDTIQE